MLLTMNESKTLTVIFGAGASFDCVDQATGNSNSQFKPPLVNELFALRDSFSAIMDKYPRVRDVSDEIRSKMLHEKISLEKLFREMFDRDDPHSVADYSQIPLYLQELLGEVSRHYVGIGTASKYNSLVRMIARSRQFSKVAYVTLNYDLLLDKAISGYYNHEFQKMDNYINTSQPWSLIKPHGSVNWGRRVKNYFNDDTHQTAVSALSRIGGRPELEDRIEVLSGHQDEARFKLNSFYYPSMLLPIENKKEFVCPESHISFLTEYIKNSSHYLFIGYSASDENILQLLSNANHVKGLKIVSGTREGALQTWKNISKRAKVFEDLNSMDWNEPFVEMGFSNFMNTRGAEDILA